MILGLNITLFINFIRSVYNVKNTLTKASTFLNLPLNGNFDHELYSLT